MDLRSTLVVVGGSVCSFKLLNTIIRLLPTPEPARKKAWRWRNTITSLAHSSLTGAWAVYGYFIHDFLDVGLSQPLKQCWELLLHHSTVISCFSLAVTSRLYLGLAVVSLLIEINSVFLHIRQLLLVSGRRNRPGTETAAPRPSVAYRLASWLNLGTLLVFRVCTMGWMTRWLAAHSERLPCYVFMIGTVGMSLISTMNIVLFYRLLRADILSNNHTNGNH